MFLPSQKTSAVTLVHMLITTSATHVRHAVSVHSNYTINLMMKST